MDLQRPVAEVAALVTIVTPCQCHHWHPLFPQLLPGGEAAPAGAEDPDQVPGERPVPAGPPAAEGVHQALHGAGRHGDGEAGTGAGAQRLRQHPEVSGRPAWGVRGLRPRCAALTPASAQREHGGDHAQRGGPGDQPHQRDLLRQLQERGKCCCQGLYSGPGTGSGLRWDVGRTPGGLCGGVSGLLVAWE